ncbi:AAA family ATPase, partial [Candidatus Bipolaricaulota bacterium]|nr:AAA family ATPase [Candidatus Bipolaricaulota bacterium]
MLNELRIHLFGFPRIECDHEQITFSRRKALALLAYLATTCQGHSRENLAALLWPEASPEKAFAYLRNLLWMLRRSKVAPWLETGRHIIALTRNENTRVDVLELRDCLSRAQNEVKTGALSTRDETGGWESRLVTVVNEIKGRFLEGFHVDDSEPFDQWQLSEGEALRVDQADALDLIIRRFQEKQAPKEAIRYARLLVATDILNEEHQRRLMELLVSDGQRTEALRVYESCRNVLLRDLGLEPSEETVALASSVAASKDDAASPVRMAPSLIGVPSYPTELEGRVEELQRIHRLIEDGARLISLTGIGGVGKTRLAVEATAQLADRFPDGVAFVSLSSVHTANATVSAILDALGLGPGIPLSPRGSAEKRIRGSLTEQLGSRRLLILLDEADDIGDGVSVIKTLLETVPFAVLLVTARKPLNIVGEWMIRVIGLSYEPLGSAALPEQRRKAPAVQLFLKTARRASEAFVVTSDVIEAAEQICRFVAGHPLGIEMAARWARVLPAERIAETIERDLELLRSDAELPASRHRSLLQVYVAAWEALSTRAQAVLVRLSVFQGGFSTEAAAMVCNATPSDLAQLVDRGLIRRTSTSRFAIHEALRQFAAGRTTVADEEIEPSRRLHLAFYLDLIERSERRLVGPDQAIALRELVDDWGNVRSAWCEALKTGDLDRVRRSARAVFFINDIRSDFSDGTEMFGEASRMLQAGKADSELRGLVLGLEAWFHRWSSPTKMRELFSRSIALLDQGPFNSSYALISVLAGFADPSVETSSKLAENSRRAIRLFHDLGDRWGEAVALESFAVLRTHQRASLREVEQLISDSLRLRQELGDAWGTSLLQFTLAQCRKAEGRFDEALSLLRDSRGLRLKLGVDPLGAADCLVVESQIHTAVGNYAVAISCARQASEELSRLGVEMDDAWARLVEGEAHWGAGDETSAVESWTSAYRMTRRLHADRYSSFVAHRLAVAAIQRGDLIMAQAHAQSSVDHAPDELWGSLALAYLELAAGRTDEARAHVAKTWQKALQSPPEQQFLQEVLAVWAALLIQLNELEPAVRAVEDGIRQLPMTARQRDHLIALRAR